MSPRTRRNKIKQERKIAKGVREMSAEDKTEIEKYVEYLQDLNAGGTGLDTRMGHDIQATYERAYRRENPAPDYLIRKQSGNQFFKGKVKTETAEKMFTDPEMVELANRFSMPGVSDDYAREKYKLLAQRRYGIKNILDRKKGAFDWKAWSEAYNNLKNSVG